ncbi:hypothetical protein KIL84_023451 [Mauremys mutica]|uniref:Uncharacterized protein n=1 Tax=Mauremys mutica TaxID=74926 RepID=A0A9D3WPT7_9SAUR|nr:hypothetical protein KIL84_023451 [Mauremys mutica]
MLSALHMPGKGEDSEEELLWAHGEAGPLNPVSTHATRADSFLSQATGERTPCPSTSPVSSQPLRNPGVGDSLCQGISWQNAAVDLRTCGYTTLRPQGSCPQVSMHHPSPASPHRG